MRRLAPLVLWLASCASVPPLEELGLQCREERDPARRLDLVRRILDAGDERSIPVLIDCLEAARKTGKGPDRVYGVGTIEPNVTVPPEFWGLYLLTGKDFDLDADKWRAWYEAHRGRLVWDGGKRRFFVK